jgi:hypothetical protein
MIAYVGQHCESRIRDIGQTMAVPIKHCYHAVHALHCLREPGDEMAAGIGKPADGAVAN